MAHPPSEDQLNAMVVLQRIQMAWIMFWVVLVVFVLLLLLFTYAMVSANWGLIERTSLGVLDLLVGSCLVPIIRYLFPNPKHSAYRAE